MLKSNRHAYEYKNMWSNGRPQHAKILVHLNILRFRPKIIDIYIFKVKTFWSQIKMIFKETNLLTLPKPSKFQSTPFLFWKWIKLTRVFESCSVCTVYGCNIPDTLKLDTPKDLPKLGSSHSPTFFYVAELTPGSKSFHSYLSNESCIYIQ